MTKNSNLLSLVSDDAVDQDLEIPAFPLVQSLEPGEAITLSLQDLLPDNKGEVVLEDSLGSLFIMEGAGVTEQGILGEGHVTHGGQDVSGMSYAAHFSEGLTLYYDPQTTIEFI